MAREVEPTVSSVLASWDDFCDNLKRAGHDVLALRPPNTAEDAAEAIQFVTRLARLGLDHMLDGRDPVRPRLSHVDRVSAGAMIYAPNIDNHYYLANIDGNETYRLTFNTDTIGDINISVHNGWGTPGVFGNVTFDDLEIVHDEVELWLSPEPHEGNTIEMPTTASFVFIRVYYFDWATNEPPMLRIECVSRDGTEPTQLTFDDLSYGLSDALAWITPKIRGLLTWGDNFFGRCEGRNQFSTPWMAPEGGTNIVQYGGTEFLLEPDEALLMEFEPPNAKTWTVQWHRRPWGDAADFFRHIVSLNKFQAHVDTDGKVRIAFAHHDPGIQNWISTEGRREGLAMYRWIWSEDSPTPVGRVVKFDDLASVLPADTPRFGPADRAEQMAIRTRHLSLRY